MSLVHAKKEPEPLTGTTGMSGLLVSFLWWCGILRKRSSKPAGGPPARVQKTEPERGPDLRTK
jgi:hypothetical protein